MSVEFFGTCPDKDKVSLEKIIEYLKNHNLAEDVYGPFGGEGKQMAFFFPERGIRGFSATFMENENGANFSFRQNILPSLNDWQSLLAALQFSVRFSGCKIWDEENNTVNDATLEKWKNEEVYHERHLYEAEGIVEQLRNGDDSFTFPTYPFDLKVFRSDIDLNASIDEQFDRIMKILEEQVEHFSSCYIPSIMKFRSQSGIERTMITWTPTVPTITWEADSICLTKMTFGENKVISFQALLNIVGDRVKHIGSITANRDRFELPVLDFKKSEDQQLKTKLLALESIL